MKKKIIIGSIAVLFIIIIAVIYQVFKGDYKKQLELEVKTNGGVPYRWEYEIENGEIVKYIDNYIIKDENKNDKVGAPIYYNYVFEGLKKGKTKIVLRYVSITDNKVEKEKTYYVEVNSKKDILLINTK